MPADPTPGGAEPTYRKVGKLKPGSVRGFTFEEAAKIVNDAQRMIDKMKLEESRPVPNNPTPEAVEAAREIIRPLGDSAIADIHRKRAEGIIQAAIDAATARLAAEVGRLRNETERLAQGWLDAEGVNGDGSPNSALKAAEQEAARLAAENDDLRWALKKLAGQFRIDSALRAIVDARLDGHPKPRALYDRYAEQKDENLRLAAERDEARAALANVHELALDLGACETCAHTNPECQIVQVTRAALAPAAGGNPQS